jgi:peptide-methionine (R)-S-oxide reductase
MTMTHTSPDRRTFLTLAGAGAAGFALWGCSSQSAQAAERFEVTLSDAQWRKKLSPDAYNVLRKEATERPYSSPLNGEHRAGIFSCAGCALPAFSSKTKFESGTGWPSFWQPLPNAVRTRVDSTLGMARTGNRLTGSARVVYEREDAARVGRAMLHRGELGGVGTLRCAGHADHLERRLRGGVEHLATRCMA